MFGLFVCFELFPIISYLSNAEVTHPSSSLNAFPFLASGICPQKK